MEMQAFKDALVAVFETETVLEKEMLEKERGKERSSARLALPLWNDRPRSRRSGSAST